jgi:hypothetical protein
MALISYMYLDWLMPHQLSIRSVNHRMKQRGRVKSGDTKISLEYAGIDIQFYISHLIQNEIQLSYLVEMLVLSVSETKDSKCET